ncbi:MAG: hypothetical protein KF866_10290 [Phycisphaeraceae bacterium]|nr:hypothetical protein [Phycisphaeraceae bacterium]MCW5754890.1 hypothetical protein [Phycisphaeraceae bacterium]
MLAAACAFEPMAYLVAMQTLGGKTTKALRPTHQSQDGNARVYVGDCRDLLGRIPECVLGNVDLIFADPPFNWNRKYDRLGSGDTWDDAALSEAEYLTFTYDWIDACLRALKPTGSLFINIPDDWAAEITCYLKGRLERKPVHLMHMVNWCIWHYRFGQNTVGRYINSKVHVLYFCKDPLTRTFNAEQVLEVSDRRSTYFDPRTEAKRDGMPAGMRLPMDVWYGKFWGRIQGNNSERRANHDNQLPEIYLERVILGHSNPGDLVLDPFLGSGTTGTVAHAHGRRFIGTEFSPTLARSAFERMTKLGMVRKGASLGQSTAIFKARRTQKHAKASTSN